MPSERTGGRVRLGLVLLGALLALLGGFLLPGRGQLEDLYSQWGFAGIFLTFVLWALAMWRLRPASREEVLGLWRRNRLPLCLAALLLVAAFCLAPPKMRVQYDEANLAGMAFAMHQEHGVWVPEGGYYKAGSYLDLKHMLDKRPLTYPFLVYLAHTLTGYRLANSYAVNFLAGAGALFLLFVLLRRWTSPACAYCGMLFMAAYPMFVLWSASGGFEVLNVFWLLLSVLLLDTLARRRDAATTAAFAATLAVLAQCRYESALFLLPGLLIGALLLSRREWLRLPWWLGLLPLALMPLAWQQLRFLDPAHHQMTGSSMFAFSYFITHLQLAWQAFSGFAPQYLTLPAGIYLAVAGFAAALWGGVRRGGLGRRGNWPVAAYLLLGYGLVTAVQFAYHMGDLTQNITARLGVVYLPLLALGVAFLVHEAGRRWQGAGAAGIAVSLGLLLWTWPVAAHPSSLNGLITPRYYEMTEEFLADRGPGEILVIAERGHPLILKGYSSIPFPMANSNLGSLASLLQNHFFQEILAVQILDSRTGRPVNEELVLDPRVTLETVYEEQISMTGLLRISRLLPPGGGDTPGS